MSADDVPAPDDRTPGLVIAVDGPAASGKGTLARRLAEHYGLPHLDTGLLYRAVGLRAFGARDADAEAVRAAQNFDAAWIGAGGEPAPGAPGDDDLAALRTRRAGDAASRVAALPAVRAALKAFQVAFARRPGGAVLDGRDTGTAIAPFADVKIWVDADPRVRAARRAAELRARGEPVDEAAVLADLAARDARDAPNMLRAPDSRLLDTSALDREAAFRAALDLVEGARGRPQRGASSPAPPRFEASPSPR